jgi:hypothetical protein
MEQHDMLHAAMAELVSALAAASAVKVISDSIGVPVQSASLVDHHGITLAEYRAYQAMEEAARAGWHQTQCSGWRSLG